MQSESDAVPESHRLPRVRQQTDFELHSNLASSFEKAKKLPLTCLWLLVAISRAADGPQQDPAGPAALKSMTLEELSQTEVTTPSKGPGNAFQTPAAIYVITGEDIRPSGRDHHSRGDPARPGRRKLRASTAANGPSGSVDLEAVLRRPCWC
jgi:hypothetical protein